MIERSVSNSSRIRARQTGLVSPASRRPVFKIEDAAGRVLRRIGTARHAAEAVAHYWRTTGCDAKLTPAMAEPPSPPPRPARLGGGPFPRPKRFAGGHADR